MAEVIVALDFASGARALALVDRLGSRADFYKVGLELFTRSGPDILRELRQRDKRIFLDLKLHDIPNTVAGAVRAAAAQGVELLTVHCTGGAGMMRAAAEVAEAAAAEAAADIPRPAAAEAAAEGPKAAAEVARRTAEAASPRLRLLGVTLLTSFTISEIETTWGRGQLSLGDEVIRLAAGAREAGLDGVVASAAEAASLKRKLGQECLVVTPGIRLPGDDPHDQSRIATPAEARSAGADFIVVGRTITASPAPEAALTEVLANLEAARPASATASAQPGVRS